MTQARGPEFLPYPLPDRTAAPATAVVPAEQARKGRWQAAALALTPWGVAALTAAVVAAVAMLLVSLITDHRTSGAVLTSIAAVVCVGSGVRALKDEQPEDSKTVVKGSMGSAVVSAVIALLLLVGNDSSVAEQPPVLVPSPQPTQTQQQPSPTPSQTPQLPDAPGSPTPGQVPGLGVLPPGSTDLFGIPTQPDQSTSLDPAAKGVLAGRVVSTSGAGVPGAMVTITRASPGDTSESPGCPLKVVAKTNAAGRYSVPLCQLGDNLGYHVVITAGGAGAQTDLFVNAGQVTVYNVILAIRKA